MSEPWSGSDPGEPYAGPPRTTPPVYGAPGPYPGQPYPGRPYSGQPGPYGGAPYGYPYDSPGGYGVPPYGYPAPWGPGAAAEARRPGQVLAAAVLAFVQAGIVAVASAYVFLFVSFARIAASEGATPSAAVEGLAGEGTFLAWLQLASVVLLVAGGVLALGRRRSRPAWLVLTGALIAQIVLALYWGVRLDTLTSDVAGPDPAGVFAWFSLFFAAMPLVALGLLLVGPGRAWFREEVLPGQG